MKARTTLALAFAVALFPNTAAAQHQGHSQPSQPTLPTGVHQQHGAPAPPAQAGNAAAAPEKPAPLPRLTSAEGAIGLEQLEELARKNNPTLRQAEAEIRSARARARQAGLFPNPVIGYTGDEIRGGDVGGGKHGGFIEQALPLGGRLGAERAVFAQETRMAESELEEQRLRVITGIRIGYYRALAAQELLQTQRDFAALIEAQLQTARRLQNIGQLDATEVLQSEIEWEHAKIAVERQGNRLRSAWAELAAVAGVPELPLQPLRGALDHLPAPVDDAEMLRKLLEESPTVRLAETNVARAQAAVHSARRAWIPDLQVRVGVQQNREFLEDGSQTGRRIGAEGLAEVGLQLPIFNRNQGAVAARVAEVERANLEQQRVRLLLRQRAIALSQSNHAARLTAERYRNAIIPRARQSYELMLRRWGQMGVSYPQLLLTQRTLFEAQTGYIAALDEVWTTSLTLEGFLLTEGLGSPARPGEVDMPVRETNSPQAAGGGGE